jgi:hypothetical protein
MRKLLLLSALFLTSCTLYTEKQSEALSQNVYATSDSLNSARVDLAYFYAGESIKFIKPPKHSIKIDAIYKDETSVPSVKSADVIVKDKTRMVIVPEQYKNDKVVVVGSESYQKLLQDREIKKQLEKDNYNKEKQLATNNKELAKQQEMHDKMVKDLNHLQSEVYKKDAIIFKLILVIVLLSLIIGGYIAFRVSRKAGPLALL